MYLGLKIGDICIEDIQFSLYCVHYNALYILGKETMGDYAKSDFNGTAFLNNHNLEQNDQTHFVLMSPFAKMHK